MHTITRLYETAQQATHAVQELKRYGFDESLINVVAHDSADRAGAVPAARDAAAAAASIMAGGVLRAEALDYAVAVQQGRSLVSVRAPFGTGAVAIGVLERCGPVDDDIQRARHVVAGWDDAAPFSSVLWIPALADGAAPFSRFWNLPVLTARGDNGLLSTLLALPLLTRRGSTLSSKLGLPLLTRRGSTLSSKLGLPLLLKGRSARR